jgi:FemAB-related protein (PEP-CTERM system-associated)
VLFGSHLCSLPYLDAAGIVADDPAAQEALCGQARQLSRELKADWVELRQYSRLQGLEHVRTDKVSLCLPLPAASEELWDSLKPKVRNQVRKAQNANLSTCLGRDELLNEFYRIYTRNMRDLGSPPHSMRFFQLILRSFPESARLFVVRLADRPVAASFTLTDPQAMRVPWAGSDWRCSDLSPNMLLYWSMLQDACRRSAPSFDFGRSTRDSGTYRFKTQWGSHEVPLYWHYLLAQGRQMPQLRPDNPKYRLIAACWRRLPVSVVRALGPRIIAKLT